MAEYRIRVLTASEADARYLRFLPAYLEESALNAKLAQTKSAIGLGNVDNTSDMNKPVSTAQAAAIATKYTKPQTGIPLTDLAATGTPSSTTFLRGDGTWVAGAGGSGAVSSVSGRAGDVTLTKADVSLGNVDNTADTDKPVSTAQASAIAVKYTKPSTGIPLSDLAVTGAPSTSTFLRGDGTWGAPPTSTGTSGVSTVAGRSGDVTITKTDVGLSNVDNTSDASKPVSAPQAAAIADKYSKPQTGIPTSDLATAVQNSLTKADSAVQPGSLNKTVVGLSNVDNTSDADKPISTAQATALGNKYTKPQSGIPATDLTSTAQASLAKADAALPAANFTKAALGLSNVDNTSDENKPLSAVQAAAISAKYTKPSTGIPLSDVATTGTPSSTTFLRGDGVWVFVPTSADVAAKANIVSPALSGTPTAPTAPVNTNTTQIATTAFVMAAIQAYLSSNPQNPTPSYTDNGDGTIDLNSLYTDNGDGTLSLPDGSYTDNGDGTISIG